MTDWQNIVWPLAFILVALVAMRQLSKDLNPVFRVVIGGVAQNASKNAMAYAMAIMFGLSASMSAFWDVFHTLGRAEIAAMSWHQYAAMWTKVLNPFIVAVLAYATKNDFQPAVPPSDSSPKSS